MSEIKGQILGIVLVLSIFGLVGTALIAIFRNLTTTVENKVDQEISNVEAAEATVLSDFEYLHY